MGLGSDCARSPVGHRSNRNIRGNEPPVACLKYTISPPSIRYHGGCSEVYSKAVDEQVGTKKAYPYFNSAQTIKKPSNEGKGYAHHAKI